MPTTVNFDPEKRRREAQTTLGINSNSSVEEVRQLVIFPKCHDRQRRRPGLRRGTAETDGVSSSTTSNTTDNAPKRDSSPKQPSLRRAVTEGAASKDAKQQLKKEQAKYRSSLSAVAGPGAYNCVPEKDDLLAVPVTNSGILRGLQRDTSPKSSGTSHHEQGQDLAAFLQANNPDDSRHSHVSLGSGGGASVTSYSERSAASVRLGDSIAVYSPKSHTRHFDPMNTTNSREQLQSRSLQSASLQHQNSMPEQLQHTSRSRLRPQCFQSSSTSSSNSPKEQLQSYSFQAAPNQDQQDPQPQPVKSQLQSQSLQEMSVRNSTLTRTGQRISMSRSCQTSPVRTGVHRNSSGGSTASGGRIRMTSNIPKPANVHQRASTEPTASSIVQARTRMPRQLAIRNIMDDDSYSRACMDSSHSSRTADLQDSYNSTSTSQEGSERQPKEAGGVFAKLFKAGGRNKIKEMFQKSNGKEKDLLRLMDPLHDYKLKK